MAYALTSVIAFCQADTLSSSLPLSVDAVEIRRVDDSLIRMIRHNMEVKPVIEIERINVPIVELAQVLRITEVKVGDTLLPFTNITGVFVDDLALDKKGKTVKFTLDYFYPRGGSDYIKCEVPVGNNNVGEVHCRFGKRGNDD